MTTIGDGLVMEDGVHPVRPCDVAILVALCMDHALYEQASYDPAGKVKGLQRVLFATPPRLYSWLAWRGGVPMGYATASVEFSTFAAAEYMHMDCLFVDAKVRGNRVGQALMDAVVAMTRSLGLQEVQWQTPEWNDGAVRFYERRGAVAKAKQRFTLTV
jgi:GNAT superfamily N-acetyltransferase